MERSKNEIEERKGRTRNSSSDRRGGSEVKCKLEEREVAVEEKTWRVVKMRQETAKAVRE